MSFEEQSSIRLRAIDVIRRLRGQGYDRALIMSFAAEVLGQLTTTIKRNE